MSAATLRRPAGWHRVVRAEAAALLRSRWMPVVLVLIVLLTSGSFGTDSDGPFGEAAELTVLMFFFPLLLWRGRGGRGSLDGAMPVGATAHELIRIGVGAAAALVVLCIATGAFTLVFVSRLVPSELGGFARGYTAALIIRGLAAYLLASAILLGARRPGRVLLTVYFIGSVLLLLLGTGLERTTRQTTFAPDGTVTGVTLSSSLTIHSALMQLAVAAAIVGAFVWMGGREAGLSLPWRRAGGTAPLARTTAVPRTALAVPRRPASSSAVAMRQLVIQAPRMVWPLLGAALLGLWNVAGGLGVGGMTDRGALYVGGFFLLWLVSYLWPLLVWMDERGGRPWDEAQPVDAFRRRLLHWMAGLAWLEACVGVLLAGHVAGAAAGGTLASAAWLPAWVLPGVPLAVMALYCVGTVPAVLAAHPVRGSILTLLVVGPALQLLMAMTTGRGSPVSLARLLAPVQASANHEWSLAAALVWIPLFATLALLALRRRAALDRGATSLPTR